MRVCADILQGHTNADLLQLACVRLVPIDSRTGLRIDIWAAIHEVTKGVQHRRILRRLADASRRRRIAPPSPVLAHTTKLQQVGEGRGCVGRAGVFRVRGGTHYAAFEAYSNKRTSRTDFSMRSVSSVRQR